jgi:cell division protein FtsW
VVLGSVALYSAVVSTGHPDLFYKQMIHLAIGAVVCLALALVDYRRWNGWLVWVLYAVAIVLLILVFVPGIGVLTLGAHRWIRVGGFTFQASEFAKLALILALAAFAHRHQRKMSTFTHGILLTGAIIGPVLGLIFIEVDVGTTATLGATAIIMLLVAGVRWLHVLPIGAVALAGLVTFVATDEVRMERVQALLNPEEHAQGKGMQANNAVQALSAGGPGGFGLAESPFKRGRYVPFHYSDFIFSVVGAEGGLVATLGTVLLFTSFLCCGVYISWHARDMFGLLLVTGITFFIAMQAFIHMGVVTGILPNKGFPLPFMSHGGTNLLFNLAGVGLIFSVARRGIASVKAKNPFERHVDVPVAEAA